MDNNQAPRALSHDEKNAAAAAFAGRPLNPKWSARARSVYEGIIKALPSRPETAIEDSNLAESTATPIESIDSESVTQPESSTTDQTDDKSGKDGTLPSEIPLEQALASGALIDVTPTAKELGFSFPVTVTKPLWEVGIAPSSTLSPEEQSGRLRDVLMAFRLRLATQQTIAPLIDFPALLAFPPSNVPQPISLFALIQPDEQNRAMATLLLPNEVAATVIPLN